MINITDFLHKEMIDQKRNGFFLFCFFQILNNIKRMYEMSEKVPQLLNFELLLYCLI
jgi:hypothetical protein